MTHFYQAELGFLNEMIEKNKLVVRAIEYDRQGDVKAVSFHGSEAKVERCGGRWAVTVEDTSFRILSEYDLKQTAESMSERARKLSDERQDVLFRYNVVCAFLKTKELFSQ